jgi:hypothetical protein
MTPVDPAFLLIPILQAAHPVNSSCIVFITLSNCSTQQDGTLGTFRPADDIFEDAARKLQPSLQSHETENPDLNNDILRFASMKVVKESLKRICDIKGSVSLLGVNVVSVHFPRDNVGDRGLSSISSEDSGVSSSQSRPPGYS